MSEPGSVAPQVVELVGAKDGMAKLIVLICTLLANKTAVTVVVATQSGTAGTFYFGDPRTMPKEAGRA